MSSRVLATQTAERAAVDLRGRLQSLQGVTRQVLALGDKLADPTSWDGPEAARFRSEWPQMGGALRQLMPALESLQRSSETVVEQIIQAGSQGGVPGAAGTSAAAGLLQNLNYYKQMATNSYRVWKFGSTTYKLGKVIQTFRSWPATARQLFGDAVNPTALAFDRGEASLSDLEAVAGRASRLIDAAGTFSKVGAMEDVVRGGMMARAAGLVGVSSQTAGRFLAPVAVVGDIFTIIHPGQTGGEGTALQVAAGANIGGTVATLGAINAATDWIPVGGEVVAAGSGLFLAGDWAYHNIPAFHDFANTVGHDTVTVADDTWHGVEHAGSSVGHFFSSIF
ncbi:MAG: hypothetical protein J2P45_18485 [Candidatus Dormibacteraeota bacterium]|nr:hypothetical protein [Candidatus Dormibacteraeota bacterium]